MSINDFDTFEDYVRYRETHGYTEQELDKLLAILEREEDIQDKYDQFNQRSDDLYGYATPIHLYQYGDRMERIRHRNKICNTRRR